MAEITNIEQFKRERELRQELAKDRKPLYVSHLTGKVTGDEDFGNRLINIRQSMNKISNLMAELKELQLEDNK